MAVKRGNQREREREIKNKKIERIKQNLVMNKNVTNTFCSCYLKAINTFCTQANISPLPFTLKNASGVFTYQLDWYNCLLNALREILSSSFDQFSRIWKQLHSFSKTSGIVEVLSYQTVEYFDGLYSIIFICSVMKLCTHETHINEGKYIFTHTYIKRTYILIYICNNMMAGKLYFND